MDESVAIVLPVRNLAGSVETPIKTWCNALANLGRAWELLVVDDGSTDGTETKLDAVKRPNVRILKLGTPQGQGACLRAALAETNHPLLLLAGSEYPYSPGDVKLLLHRIETESEVPDPATGEFVLRKPDAVCGCRTGVPVPMSFKVAGWLYRWFCKIALGLPLQRLPGWYGFREHAFAWWAWIVYGVPLEDPNARFKLFRTAFLKRFPIQSDGDFVHIELIAKATFLTCVLDEVPLTPQRQSIPKATWTKADRKRVFQKPEFAVRKETTPAPLQTV
jgi:glycosyltransferase involved in cell wall biosynthesis